MKKFLGLAGCGVFFLQFAQAQTSMNQFLFDDYLIAPVRVHLLSAKDSSVIKTTLVEPDITRILGKLNVVWSQAGLHFYLESLVAEEATQPELYALAIQGERSGLLGVRPNGSLASNIFHIYYLKQMPMNGIYFEEGIFVKDTASLRKVEGGLDEPLPRVTSHELGHAFGLPHRQSTTNLMASGTTGTWLNQEEINQAREMARKFDWICAAPDLLKKANTLFGSNEILEAGLLYSRLATIPLHNPQVELAKSRVTQARAIRSAKGR